MTTNKYNTQKPTIDETHTTIPNSPHEEDKTEVNANSIPKNTQNSNILSQSMTNTSLPNEQIKRSLPSSSSPTSPTISEQPDTQLIIETPTQKKNLEYKLLESKKTRKYHRIKIKN